jgi:cell shape-determining protein MreD
MPALMVFTALSAGLTTVTCLAVLAGLGIDSLSANPLGATILPLFLLGFIIYQNRPYLLRNQFYAQLALGVGAGAFVPIMTFLIIRSAGETPIFGWGTLWHLLLIMLSSGLLTPLCFGLFGKLYQSLNYQPLNSVSFRADREIKRSR